MARDIDFEGISSALAALGLPAPSPDDVSHFRALVEAYDVYLDRQEEYGSLWKLSGYDNNLMQAKSKIARMQNTNNSSTFHDSAMDLINYAVFADLNGAVGRKKDIS